MKLHDGRPPHLHHFEFTLEANPTTLPRDVQTHHNHRRFQRSFQAESITGKPFLDLIRKNRRNRHFHHLASFTRERHRHRRNLLPKRNPYTARTTNLTVRVAKIPDLPSKRQNLTTSPKADRLP
ncbi:Uncharacterized protein Rs2_12727 [Raphanus sativus]|nr:Uncharacterized protein Rs2_12727 [Raphanus sativus]